jgi:leucyl aminopeptidase
MPPESNIFAHPSSQAVPLYLVASANAEDWLSAKGSRAQNSATSQSWNGELGQILCVTENGLPIVLAIGLGDATARSRNRFGAVANIASLPAAIFNLTDQSSEIAQDFALSFALSKYRFTRYAETATSKAELICPAGVDPQRLQAIIEGEFLTRDLINTPANDMGPDELEAAARDRWG